MNGAYIFDIDMTLADSSDRLHILDEKDFERAPDSEWDRFYSGMEYDSRIDSVCDILNELVRNKKSVFISTGRSERYREETLRWLVGHTLLLGVQADRILYMRKHGDMRPSREVKRDNLHRIKANVVAAFEDRTEDCQMYREEGVTTFQVKGIENAVS